MKSVSTVSFQDHVLAVLTQRTASPGQLHPLTDDLLKDISLRAGFDPDNLGQYGTPEDGWFWVTPGTNPRLTNSLSCRIQIAYGQLKGLTVKGREGWWGLTDEGLVAGRRLLMPTTTPKAVVVSSKSDKASPVTNVTARFLSERLNAPGSKLLDTMRRYVANNLPVSARAGTVDDHVHNCIVKLIHRDALAERIASGEVIKDYYIATWAIHSAFGDIRNDGTEPVARELYGARTERERTQGIVLPNRISDRRVVATASARKRVERAEAQDVDAANVDIVDTETSFTSGAVEDAIEFNQIWGQVEDIINSKMETGEQYLTVLRLKATGMTNKEIAAAEGLSLAATNALLNKARKVVQRGLRVRGIAP